MHFGGTSLLDFLSLFALSLARSVQSLSKARCLCVTADKYKTFDSSDILANLLGSGLGLFGATRFDQYYRARRELESLYAPLDMETYDEEDPEDAAHPRTELNVWDDRMDDDGETQDANLFRLEDEN